MAVEDTKKEEESKPVPKKQVSVSAVRRSYLMIFVLIWRFEVCMLMLYFQPIKIRDRNFEQNDEEKTPRIKWECNLVKNLINTALLKVSHTTLHTLYTVSLA